MAKGLKPETVSALQRWINDRIPALNGVTIAGVGVPGVGMSADTLFIDVEERQDGQRRMVELVLRRQRPGAELCLNGDLTWQYRVLEALARHSNIPVPPVVGIETGNAPIGSPFFIMQRVAGRVLPQRPNYNLDSWLADLPKRQRGQVWINAVHTFACLHQVPWERHFGFMSRLEDAAPGLDQHLAHLQSWLTWAAQGREQPTIEAALEWLQRHKPSDAPVQLLWGDPTPANIVFGQDFAVTALLDWEMACLGPGEIDLAWFLMFDDFYSRYRNVPRLPGLPEHAAVIQAYEAAAGRPTTNLDYYYLAAMVRFAIVFVRASNRYADYKNCGPDFDASTHNPITAEIARRIGLPIPQPGCGWAELMSPAGK